MIHNRAGRKFNRTRSHRKAMFSNLSTSLLKHKKIQTTLAKAKEMRMVVEKVITRAKRAVAEETVSGKLNIHARREVARFIHDREVVKTLFTEIAPKVANRPGGYTRVVKLGQRLGDGAQIAILELVDFNVGQVEQKVAPKVDRKKRINQKTQKTKESKKDKVAEATTAA